MVTKVSVIDKKMAHPNEIQVKFRIPSYEGTFEGTFEGTKVTFKGYQVVCHSHYIVDSLISLTR